MEHFPPGLRNQWKDWEIRFLVLLSLTLQIVLIFFGNRRKYTSRTWMRSVLWCAYLMADWAAAFALGVISNNLGHVIESIVKDGSHNENIQLTAFWAPFLLLHLGSPDTVTAYSMEDNELWLRHLVGLFVQSGVVLYIIMVPWTDARLFISSLLMFFVGIIKYGERIWVLRSASNEQFRESMLTPPDPGPNYSKFMREYNLKQIEGYHARAEGVNKAPVVNLPSFDENNPICDATELAAAYDFFKTFRRLFVDLILGLDDRDNSQSLFKEISWNKAFKVIEMELGFMYDVLYTKAIVIHSPKYWCLRLISFSFSSTALGLFLVIHKHKYSIIDLVLTFLLLGVAIALELYAFLLLLSSDWTDLWLSKHASTSIHQAIICLQLPKQPRWSNSMSQFNLLSFSLKDKWTICYGIQKLLRIDKFLEKRRYTTCEEVHDNLKIFIFNHLKEKFSFLKETSNDAIDNRTLCSHRGGPVLEKYNYYCLNWSLEVEFDQSILIWHIATDLCYHLDSRDQDRDASILNCELSKWLSQYMLYILVRCPLMLPMGIGMTSLPDTCAEIKQFFEERKSRADGVESYSDTLQKAFSWAMSCFQTGKPTLDKSNMCKMMLLKMNTQVPPSEVKGDRSKTVLFDACRLASKLQAISDQNQKWEMISNVWVEMLAYAACHCRGYYHAQQLKQGGEILTHVWLLMAHFGLTQHFQISQGHARAKLVVA